MFWNLVYTGPGKFWNGLIFYLSKLFTRNRENLVIDCRTVPFQNLYGSEKRKAPNPWKILFRSKICPDLCKQRLKALKYEVLSFC